VILCPGRSIYSKYLVASSVSPNSSKDYSSMEIHNCSKETTNHRHPGHNCSFTGKLQWLEQNFLGSDSSFLANNENCTWISWGYPCC